MNRDTGEFGLNSTYDNLLRLNKVNLIHLRVLTSVHLICQINLLNRNRKGQGDLLSLLH